MNPCQICGAPATVYLSKIVNKQKEELYLCDKCEQERQLMPTHPTPHINLPALLSLLTSQVFSPATTPPEVDPPPAVCPVCGWKYAQFRTEGRLGCGHDYDTFDAVLQPLLERVHRGLRHAGKVPRRADAARRAADEVAHLRQQLADAVAAERYEEAARLRDRLREKEVAG